MIDKSERHSPPQGHEKPVLRHHFSRWRVATLITVYLLFIVHIVHWRVFGRTLAPLELNEVMYTLELGIITAGFIFMAVTVIATLLFGRFFCSWGCHILALEDLAAWLLTKFHIHPKPIRSRVLRWVPLFAMLYMFVWPQVSRLISGRAMPTLHLRTDAEGWASFTTSDFWRNLPGPGVTFATFLLCGFVIVYILGSRAFCTYACPYGAIFRIADRFAVGRIVARGDCSQCGKCTATCQSHVQVHRELTAYGRVTDPSCLKDLDCVAACPNGRIAYGVAKPAIMTIGATNRITKLPYDFTRVEDAFMAIVFIATLLIFRGLYDFFPFLMTLAFASILSFLFVLLLRIIHRPSVRLNYFRLVMENRITRTGWAFAILGMVVILFTLHSAVIRYHEYKGQRNFETFSKLDASADVSDRERLLEQGIQYMEYCDRWGLFRPARHQARLAQFHTGLGQSRANRGEMRDAATHFARSAALVPGDAPRHYNLGVILSALGHKSEAISSYRRAANLTPNDPEIHNNLGLLLAQSDDLQSAEAHLTLAIRLNSEFAAPRFNLGRVYQALGRWQEARESLSSAARLDPSYASFVHELLQLQSTHEQAGISHIGS